MRIDFYQLSGRYSDPLFVTGVLVGRAWPKAGRIAVVGPPDALSKLDEQLWELPEGRFLPHAINGDAPIRLLESPPAEADILINLDPASPLPEGRFERILEIVPPDESLKKKLRERWVAWKKRGAELHHHVLR